MSGRADLTREARGHSEKELLVRATLALERIADVLEEWRDFRLRVRSAFTGTGGGKSAGGAGRGDESG